MTDLSAQKRMASDVLDVGKNRVWFDPERQDDIADAITREDIRDLISDGGIQKSDASGNSRGRARERQAKRAYGHQQGAGSRKGRAGARQNSKEAWESRIRAQRKALRDLRDDGTLTSSQYRTLYNRAGGGEFDSVADVKRHIENNLSDA